MMYWGSVELGCLESAAWWSFVVGSVSWGVARAHRILFSLSH